MVRSALFPDFILMIRHFVVDEICFDFEMEDDEYPSTSYQRSITESVVGQVYAIECEDDDEDDYVGDLLLDEITTQTGWCILSCSYQEVF